MQLNFKISPAKAYELIHGTRICSGDFVAEPLFIYFAEEISDEVIKGLAVEFERFSCLKAFNPLQEIAILLGGIFDDLEHAESATAGVFSLPTHRMCLEYGMHQHSDV
jgi:hypothetical protein